MIQVLLSLLFTVGAVIGFLAMLVLGVAIPVALKILGTSSWVQWAVDLVQWALLWIFAVLGLAFLYRYAPSRQQARWHWVTWESAISALLWLMTSVLFALYVGLYVGKCANYSKTYAVHSFFSAVAIARPVADSKRPARRGDRPGGSAY
jgi:membrane protein